MMLDATRHYAPPLTKERLFELHASLFPTGRSGMSAGSGLGAGETREPGPMQVVSGPFGQRKCPLRGAGRGQPEPEMGAFLEWFERD